MARKLAVAWLAVGICGNAFAQRPSFEVASVKLNTANGPSDSAPRRSGDRVTMHNTQLIWVVEYAYRIANFYQLAGNLRLPDGWNWYDIEAVAPGSPSDDDLRLMFQTLLEDRFKLKIHRETREGPAYDLAAVKSGAKLKAANPESKITVDDRPLSSGHGGIVGGVDGPHLVGKGATMEQLALSLSGQLHAPVRDRTGLMGTYDYNVVFARDENATDIAGPAPLTTAIQKDLGLKLEATKAPVEVLVIDHMEKPSAN